MPRHLISDAHEWINEIPTVPIYYLAKPQPRERAWQNQRGKKTLSNLNGVDSSLIALLVQRPISIGGRGRDNLVRGNPTGGLISAYSAVTPYGNPVASCCSGRRNARKGVG
ncbi:hypothetical protein F5Y02DRAFT_426156 [Annulohypoxylon stygium]|nr:hypothetical protein F5Y02DRAFT_426156 [Annulohypoxylon stygium]